MSPRPRTQDRKAQIIRAAAGAFSELGYHAVSMEEIAARVHISAAALYRYSPSKYDLFRDTISVLSQRLLDATRPPGLSLEELIGAVVDATLAHRSFGVLYRWESRYLNDVDRTIVFERLRDANRPLQQAVAQVRPELCAREAWTLSWAAFSVIGSVTDHGVSLPVSELRGLLTELGRAVLETELPAPFDSQVPNPVPPLASPDGSKYEALLCASLTLFQQKGFRETGMDEIAGAVGIQAPGIYRFFSSKGDLLAASYRRAAGRMSEDVSSVLAAEPDPVAALDRLVDLCVCRSFRDPALAYVYFTERVNVPDTDRSALRNMQRATVHEWARLLTATHPELTHTGARFIVHAAFTLIIDLGRMVPYDDTEYARTCVRRMVEMTLFGRAIS